jgi:hypothetical protein
MRLKCLPFVEVLSSTLASRDVTCNAARTWVKPLRSCEPSHTRLAVTIHTSQKNPINSKSYFLLTSKVSPSSSSFFLTNSKPNILIFIMPAISLARQSFSTFHGNTTAVLAEITSHIIEYAMADTHPLPMGGGVGTRRAHHAVASALPSRMTC